jgi:hypothetical protein
VGDEVHVLRGRACAGSAEGEVFAE